MVLVHDTLSYCASQLYEVSIKDSLNGKLSFFTHFSKFVVFIRVM